MKDAENVLEATLELIQAVIVKHETAIIEEFKLALRARTVENERLAAELSAVTERAEKAAGEIVAWIDKDYADPISSRDKKEREDFGHNVTRFSVPLYRMAQRSKPFAYARQTSGGLQVCYMQEEPPKESPWEDGTGKWIPCYADPVVAIKQKPVAIVVVGDMDHGPFTFKETSYGADALPDGEHPLYTAPVASPEIQRELAKVNDLYSQSRVDSAANWNRAEALREFIRISVIARGDVPEDVRRGAITILSTAINDTPRTDYIEKLERLANAATVASAYNSQQSRPILPERSIGQG